MTQLQAYMLSEGEAKDQKQTIISNKHWWFQTGTNQTEKFYDTDIAPAGALESALAPFGNEAQPQSSRLRRHSQEKAATQDSLWQGALHSPAVLGHFQDS